MLKMSQYQNIFIWKLHWIFRILGKIVYRINSENSPQENCGFTFYVLYIVNGLLLYEKAKQHRIAFCLREQMLKNSSLILYGLSFLWHSKIAPLSQSDGCGLSDIWCYSPSSSVLLLLLFCKKLSILTNNNLCVCSNFSIGCLQFCYHKRAPSWCLIFLPIFFKRH
jgi:hypothetical protein